MDLSGLRVLLDAQHEARIDGGQLRIAAPGRAYARLLALTEATEPM